MLDVEINTGINSSNNFLFLFFCQFAWHVETGVWFSSKLRFPGCWKGWFKHWFNCSKGWIRSWVRQEKPSDGPLACTGGKWSSWQGNLNFELPILVMYYSLFSVSRNSVWYSNCLEQRYAFWFNLMGCISWLWFEVKLLFL